MTINQIIKNTATLLGRENVLSYLNGNLTNNGDALNQIDLMTRCANLVINELACSYVPMIKEETKNSTDGKILFSSLSETALEIIDVMDTNYNQIGFTQSTDAIIPQIETVIIKYSYIPANYGLSSTVGYSEKDIPSRVISYGVASEVCLAERSIEESVAWRKRFNRALDLFLFPKNKVMKARSWL